jgi:gliding motility-associated-like protein
MKKHILNLTKTLAFLMLGFSSYAQIDLNPNGAITPEDAVQDILIGAGINAFNIEFNGSGPNALVNQQSVSEFDASNTTFPIDQGVVLQTQNAPSVNADPDLTALAGQSVTNGVILEFDFIPTGDTLSFNYIFASSEYTSFTCSQFNDVFGFFISGPGFAGPYTLGAENIATVPGTNVPVAINTVNAGTNADTGGNCAAADPNWQANSVYFTLGNNPIFTASPDIANFNGSTVVLSANADLQCNEVYHIKLAVGNAIDQILDSGVFLEANSFSSDVVDISIQAGTSATDTTLIANCTEGTIYFTRPANQTSDSLIVYFETSGTAVEGDDYPELAPGDSVIFLPGEDSIILVISPTNGGGPNDPISITVTAETITECGDTIVSEGTVWVYLEPPLVMETSDTTILCANDSVIVWAEADGGFEPYTYDWANGNSGSPTDVPVVGENGDYYFVVTATDDCGFQITDSSRVVLNQTLAIDTMFQFPTECGLSTGAVSGVGSGFTGTPFYTWSGPGEDSPNSINASVWEDLSSGWYYFSISDDVCSVNDSIFLEQDPPPTAAFDANPPAGNAPLDVTFVNNSSGGETFEWDFGNGDGNTVNDMSDQNTTYTDQGIYTVTLTVTEGACSDQASQEVIVQLVLPLDFDMPNVFTPNGDNTNDVFSINPENAVALNMVITNRWGNVVFESDNVDAAWNGRVDNAGAECTEGTYFYQFTIVGEDGQIRKEHGFVQLVRDNP